MRHIAVAAVCAAVCVLGLAEPRPAAADILVNVSKTSQRMTVLVDGSARYNWLVSTGRGRYATPNGAHQAKWLARKWRSKQYGNAPMPYSIFFHNGYAIHGTTEVSQLGKPASHGCVRLHPENAAKLFALVQKQLADTRVVVSNDVIEVPGEAPKKPSQLVAENIETEQAVTASVAEASPTIDVSSKIAPAELLVSEKPAVPQSPMVAERTSIPRQMAQSPAKPRVQTAARASTTAGFRW